MIGIISKGNERKSVDGVASNAYRTTERKMIGANVGAQAVQQTLGSIWKYRADKAVIVTTTDFTQQAREQAKGAPIELWDVKTLRKVMEKQFLKF